MAAASPVATAQCASLGTIRETFAFPRATVGLIAAARLADLIPHRIDITSNPFTAFCVFCLFVLWPDRKMNIKKTEVLSRVCACVTCG